MTVRRRDIFEVLTLETFGIVLVTECLGSRV